jgi:hypothetical protein
MIATPDTPSAPELSANMVSLTTMAPVLTRLLVRGRLGLSTMLANLLVLILRNEKIKS